MSNQASYNALIVEYTDNVARSKTQNFRRGRYEQVLVASTSDYDTQAAQVSTVGGEIVNVVLWGGIRVKAGERRWAYRTEDGELLLDDLVR